MTSVIWSVEARRDLLAILERIEEDRPGGAATLATRIFALASSIGPLISGRASRMPGLRELPVTGTPYILAFRAAGDEVTVIRLLHGARDWRSDRWPRD